MLVNFFALCLRFDTHLLFLVISRSITDRIKIPFFIGNAEIVTDVRYFSYFVSVTLCCNMVDVQVVFYPFQRVLKRNLNELLWLNRCQIFGQVFYLWTGVLFLYWFLNILHREITQYYTSEHSYILQISFLVSIISSLTVHSCTVLTASFIDLCNISISNSSTLTQLLHVQEFPEAIPSKI